ncbi:hypothetical protein H7J86_24560 [Mycobacterium hackensackense]|nr:hypothetical protein [Mycobacterium hackensackense]
MESFGGQVVTVVSRVNTGTRGRVGTLQQTPSPVDVPGCRHRPLSVKETAEYDLDTSTQVWKTTAPPVAAVTELKVDGELLVDEKAFKVVAGPQVFVDMDGNPFKVTILSIRQVT